MEFANRAEIAAGLVRIVELHDAETAVHLKATAALARRIAVRLHLPQETVASIELAGLLHDIGKIQVRREVLCKPSGLTTDEWTEMRLHAEAGAHVLEDLPSLADLAPFVRAHHERLDGDGYPDRLHSDEIPLEARVVAVADAFHALTTNRPYRHAISPAEALTVLSDAAGPQFDIDVITAIIDIVGQSKRGRRLSA